MSVVSARHENKQFGALLLLLFKLVSGSASLLAFMAWDASNESLFPWICSVERQFYTTAGLNMYRWWHGTTCLQPWEAQLASHESCNVSTCVNNWCSLGVGVNSYIKLLPQSESVSQNRFSSFWNIVWFDPNPGAHLCYHTDTQNHRHTDTHTTISKSLCSCNSGCWNIDLIIVSKFQILPNSDFFFVVQVFETWIFKDKTLCLLSLALCPSPSTLKTLLPNQTISEQINQSYLNRTCNNQTQRKSRWIGYSRVASTGLLVTLMII